jgi:hypothetical protein
MGGFFVNYYNDYIKKKPPKVILFDGFVNIE